MKEWWDSALSPEDTAEQSVTLLTITSGSTFKLIVIFFSWHFMYYYFSGPVCFKAKLKGLEEKKKISF